MSAIQTKSPKTFGFIAELHKDSAFFTTFVVNVIIMRPMVKFKTKTYYTMKSKHLIIWLMLAVVTPMFSQHARAQKYEVSGTVCDSLTHEGESFATIRITTNDKVVKVGTAQANGSFKLILPKAGTYKMECVSMGKAPLRREVKLDAAHTKCHFDTLYIKDYDATLGTATVTAQRPLVKAELDKMTYSMTDDPDAQTSSLLEMLRKVPMVTVDGEDNIKVNGNSSFKVYVNGKPNTMMSANPSMIFKAYPASAIQKIEVITNPGAKYDAEGVAGVLNIITTQKSSTSGYTLNVNANGGNRGGMGSLFAMAQLGKFMFSANYGTGYNKQGHSKTYSEREVFADDVNHLFTNNMNLTGHGVFQYGSLDASYEFSEKDLLSLSAGIHGWNGRNTSLGTSRMTDVNGREVYHYATQSRYKTLYQGINASTDFQHTFAENQRLTLSYRYDYSPQNTNATTVNSDFSTLPDGLNLRDLRTAPDNLSYEHTAQIDFTTPLEKKQKHTLSVGAKYINRINRSNSREYAREAGATEADYVLDAENSLRYRNKGDIAAAYAEYNLKVNKWAAMVGQRYEYYHVRTTYPDGKRDAFSTHLNDWVPSVSVGYNLKPTMLLKAGYNLRIGRPDISYLSPYRVSYNPEAVSYGNPNLTSERSHNFDITYSTFGPKLTVNLTLNYAFSNNGMAQYSYVENGITNTTYGNFQHSKVTTLTAFVNWTIGKTTNLNVNTSSSYADYKAHAAVLAHNYGFAGDLWGGVNQTLPAKLKLGLWIGYNSQSVNLQGKNPGFFFYNLSLNRSFLAEDRLSFTLSAGNFIGRYRHFRSNVVTDYFRSLSDGRHDLLRLSFGVSYRLGSLKSSVKKAARSIENNDVVKGNNANNGGTSSQSGQM